MWAMGAKQASMWAMGANPRDRSLTAITAAAAAAAAAVGVVVVVVVEEFFFFDHCKNVSKRQVTPPDT
jgi:hypothetical protein